MRFNRCLLIPLVLAASAAASSSFAAITIHTAASVSANGSFDNSTFDETNLFDAVITEASIDTSAIGALGSSTNNFGDAWAFGTSGVLVLDMGSSLGFDGLLYAQRTFNGNSNDDFGNVDVWVETTYPGMATLGLPATLGPADSALALIVDDNGSTLRRYDFASTFTGRYVVLSFSNGENFAGGHELRLFSVPEPASIGLLAQAR